MVKDGRYLSKEKLTPELLEKVRQLNEIAKGRGQSLAQMAVAWLLKDPRITTVLVGASTPAQMLDNIGCLKNLDFSSTELKEIAKWIN
jgi:L-glyceraldehyde 3-phosphate reductase